MPEYPLTPPPAPSNHESLSTASAPSNPTFLGEGAAVALYRGQWIEAPLSNNQLVATGGSVFSEEQTLQVRLDFSSFKDDLATWSAERVHAKIAENRGPPSLVQPNYLPYFCARPEGLSRRLGDSPATEKT